MKLSTILALSLLDCLTSSCCVTAWMIQTPRATSARRLRVPTTVWHNKNDNLDEMPPSTTVSSSSPSSSRRQWLAGVTSAAIGGAASCFVVPTAPADAVELVSSASVCDPGVSVWKKDGRLVYILGTAHISSASADLAGNLVKEIHPNGVFVELDPKRIKGTGVLAGRVQAASAGGESGEGASGDGRPQSKIIVPDIQQLSASSGATGASQLEASGTSAKPTQSAAVSKPNPVMKAASAAVGNSIKGMYKKLDTAGFQAGEEFVVAMREGQTIGSDIVLGDRDVEVTLRRVTEALARTDLKALLNPDSELEQSLKELVPSEVVSSSGNGDISGDLSDEEFRKEFSTFVETMKAKENVRKIMSQLERVAPALYEALVSERDAYMAAGLNGLNELETIVAVMGVAHVDGVERSLSMNGWKAVRPTCAVVQRT